MFFEHIFYVLVWLFQSPVVKTQTEVSILHLVKQHKKFEPTEVSYSKLIRA
jgi:hypothetical protein